MNLEKQLEALENRAVSAMRNIDPVHGTIHDYRNILNPVDRAMRALNNACIALHKAENDLRDIQSRQ
jgi:hypothetical protein